MKRNSSQRRRSTSPAKRSRTKNDTSTSTTANQPASANRVAPTGYQLGPDHISAHAGRQGAVLQMQEQMGNAYAAQQMQALLSPMGSEFQLLQRDEVEDIQGDPTAIPDDGTSIHPMIRQGSTGVAVQELQQKLNNGGATPPLVVDGIFGSKTRAAVVAFQNAHGLDADGIVGPLTWGQIDSLGLASDVGRVEREWSEEVGGQVYGMTSRYTWQILDDSMQITVKIKFTGLNDAGAIATCIGGITGVWNRFTAVNTTTGARYRIVFNAQSVGSGEDNVVRLRPGNDRSDAENWYIGDPDLANTAAHEYGHMIGLEDEYQRNHRDYTRLMGEEPGTGAEAEDGAETPANVAAELNAALMEDDEADRVTNANAVITNHNLEQGEYAQQIAAAYELAYGTPLVDHIVNRIPNDDEWSIVDPFTHSSQSIMGMMGNHEHPVETRHLREFLNYLKTARPGEYEIEES